MAPARAPLRDTHVSSYGERCRGRTFFASAVRERHAINSRMLSEGVIMSIQLIVHSYRFEPGHHIQQNCNMSRHVATAIESTSWPCMGAERAAHAARTAPRRHIASRKWRLFRVRTSSACPALGQLNRAEHCVAARACVCMQSRSE